MPYSSDATSFNVEMFWLRYWLMYFFFFFFLINAVIALKCKKKNPLQMLKNKHSGIRSIFYLATLETVMQDPSFNYVMAFKVLMNYRETAPVSQLRITGCLSLLKTG